MNRREETEAKNKLEFLRKLFHVTKNGIISLQNYYFKYDIKYRQKTYLEFPSDLALFSLCIQQLTLKSQPSPVWGFEVAVKVNVLVTYLCFNCSSMFKTIHFSF